MTRYASVLGSSSKSGTSRSNAGERRPRRRTDAVISLARRGQGICSTRATVSSIGIVHSLELDLVVFDDREGGPGIAVARKARRCRD